MEKGKCQMMSLDTRGLPDLTGSMSIYCALLNELWLHMDQFDC